MLVPKRDDVCFHVHERRDKEVCFIIILEYVSNRVKIDLFGLIWLNVIVKLYFEWRVRQMGISSDSYW